MYEKLLLTDAPVELILTGGPELPNSLGDLLDYAYSAGHAEIVFELRLNLVRTILDFFSGKNRRIWEDKAPANNAVNAVLDELYGKGRTKFSHEKSSQSRRFEVSSKTRTYSIRCLCTPSIPAGAAVLMYVIRAIELK